MPSDASRQREAAKPAVFCPDPAPLMAVHWGDVDRRGPGGCYRKDAMTQTLRYGDHASATLWSSI